MKNKMLEKASEDIRLLSKRRQAIKGIRARIRLLDADAGSIGSNDFNRLKVKCNKDKWSGRYGCVEQKEQLQQQERALQGIIDHTEQVLATMHEDDVLVLLSFYCEDKQRSDVVRQLEIELHVSQAEIYRMRERALRDFAERMGYIV